MERGQEGRGDREANRPATHLERQSTPLTVDGVRELLAVSLKQRVSLHSMLQRFGGTHPVDPVGLWKRKVSLAQRGKARQHT